jgi:hypothetical protein
LLATCETYRDNCSRWEELSVFPISMNCQVQFKICFHR